MPSTSPRLHQQRPVPSPLEDRPTNPQALITALNKYLRLYHLETDLPTAPVLELQAHHGTDSFALMGPTRQT
jgi:hypothetical protein